MADYSDTARAAGGPYTAAARPTDALPIESPPHTIVFGTTELVAEHACLTAEQEIRDRALGKALDLHLDGTGLAVDLDAVLDTAQTFAAWIRDGAIGIVESQNDDLP